MSGRKKIGGKQYSVAVYIAGGIAVGLIMILLLSFLGALLIIGGKIGENSISYIGICIIFVSAFMGARTLPEEIRVRRWMICALFALCFIATILGITALVFGGEYQSVGSGCIACVGGALLSLVGRSKKGSGRRRKRRRY